MEGRPDATRMIALYKPVTYGAAMRCLTWGEKMQDNGPWTYESDRQLQGSWQ